MKLLRSMTSFSMVLAVLTLLLGVVLLIPAFLATACAVAHIAVPPPGFTRIFGPLWVLLGFTQIGVALTSRRATRGDVSAGERTR